MASKRRGVLSERERDMLFPSPPAYPATITTIERAVLLAAARRMAKWIAEPGPSEHDPADVLRLWAKELTDGE